MKKIHNQAEWEKYYNNLRYVVEPVLNHVMHKRKKMLIPGYCCACKRTVRFVLDNNYSNGENVNFRERLVCPSCNLNNRIRGMIDLILDEIGEDKQKSIYMQEQVTPIYQYFSKCGLNVVGSEFLGFGVDGGSINEVGIRHEDAENLSFKDESFDIVISQDVFEHITNIEKAAQEVYRVLKENGKAYISVPFYFNRESTEKRATIEDGKIVHILEPMYHGNPIDPANGSLVFYDYGWDLIELFKKTGFRDVYWTPIRNIIRGNIGDNIFVLIAEK